MATMKFLKSCEPYQAEAIRVMKVLAEERGDIFSMLLVAKDLAL